MTSGTRNISKACRLHKNFNRISRANIVTSGTRNISKAWSTWKIFNRISRANIVTSGTRNISKRWSTSTIFNCISRANIVTSGTRNISESWSTSKNFNRISRANIVTSGTRNISKAWSRGCCGPPKKKVFFGGTQHPLLGRIQKISIAFLAPISWLAALATSPKLVRLQKNFYRISRAIIVTSGTRNISKRWSTSTIFNCISRANIVTSGTRNISESWSTSKNFNRISRANIVTSGTRNISKAWSRGCCGPPKKKVFFGGTQHPLLGRIQKISIAFLAPISWLAALATSPKLVRLQKNFYRISRAIIVTSGTRNISKRWSTWKNFQSHFSRQYHDERHSQHLPSLVDFKNFQSHSSRQYRDKRHSQHLQTLVDFKKFQSHFSRQYPD